MKYIIFIGIKMMVNIVKEKYIVLVTYVDQNIKFEKIAIETNTKVL